MKKREIKDLNYDKWQWGFRNCWFKGYYAFTPVTVFYFNQPTLLSLGCYIFGIGIEVFKWRQINQGLWQGTDGISEQQLSS